MVNKDKYCDVCNIKFTENYLYCPKCAATLVSFESNLSQTKSINEDGFYNITLVEERRNNKRTLFLLGSTIFVLGGATFSLIGSIYNTENYVNALDESLVYLANINNDEAENMAELELPDNRKGKDGSGGGGGGRKDKDKASKGDLPPQFKEKPLLTPSKEDISVSNPSLQAIRATRGPRDIIPDKRSNKLGIPNSKYDVSSDGYSDSNLGIGEDGDSGIGILGRDGVGKNGISGIGTKKGDKYGDDDVPGEDGDSERNRNKERDNPPQIARGETIALKIIDKPRAIYTNDARKNQIAGTVTLRVTFMANGSIGNIAVVGGLPDGLTEQAIAAAKNIKFEPAKRNGVAQTVSKQVQYTFTLY